MLGLHIFGIVKSRKELCNAAVEGLLASAFQVLTYSCRIYAPARACAIIIMATTPAQVCSLCSFRTGCVPELVSHIRLVHFSDPTFSLTCGIDECEKHFKKCSSFLSHVYRHHRQCIVREVRRKDEDEPQLECLTLGKPMLDCPTMPAPDAYAMGIQEESEPSLLDHTVHQLLGTLQNEQKNYVKVQECETVCFDSHYNSFRVLFRPSFRLLLVSSLPSYPVLHIHHLFSVSNDRYITVKQFIEI